MDSPTKLANDAARVGLCWWSRRSYPLCIACMISQCLSVLIIGMGTKGRTRSIWPYFEELLLQACVNERRGVELSCRAL